TVLNTPIATCSDLNAYVDSFTSTITEAAQRATPPQRESGHPSNRRAPILTPETRALLDLKRHLRRQFIVSGDPATKQRLSSITNRLRRLLAKTRQMNIDTLLEGAGPDNCSDFSIWKLTRGIKRQPLVQSPIQSHTGRWIKNDFDKANAFAEHLSATFTPFELPDASHRDEVADFVR
ncbi:hypothetical protein KR026_009037, partial [Drosophila bipectinata]